MSLETNKQLVSDFFEAVSTGDMAAMDRILTDDATWTLPASLSVGGVHRKAEFLTLLPQVLSVLDTPLNITPTHMISEGDHVCVLASGQAKAKSGKDYNNSYHYFLTVRDGKIAHGIESFDTAYANDVLGFASTPGH